MIAALSPLVTPVRLVRLRTAAATRTFRVTTILENVHDPHNTSAILRSADAFGVQDVHVVAASDDFVAARTVSKGAHRWLDIRYHDDAESCIDALHQSGHEVLVASMDGEVRPHELADPSRRVAIVFGNEHHGPTSLMRDRADGTYAIPMRGFVESLNVSVAAAITLYAATQHEPPLDSDAARTLLARYLMASVRDAERIIADASAAGKA